MSRLPSTGPSLQRYLRQQARAAQRQQQSSAFNLSGTSVVAADVTEVDGTLNVVGNLDVSGTANFDGNTTIGGNAAITGTLSLPSGIINNDALTSPVLPGVVNATATGFSVNLAWADAVATTITVPSGCTQLLATCFAEVYCSNNPNTSGGSDGTGTDLLDCRVALYGSTSSSFGLAIGGSGGYTTSTSAGSFSIGGLTPGASLAISAQTKSLFQNFGASANNKACITATLIWLR